MSMFPIATTGVLANATASVTFSGIPQTFSHLVIRSFYRATDPTTGSASFNLRFNGDSSNVYWKYHQIFTNGSTVVANNETNTSFAQFTYGLGGTAPANVFASAVTTIPDYTSTAKNKTIFNFCGHDTNNGSGGGFVVLRSSLWYPNTPAAITSIIIYPDVSNLAAGSRFDLYGVATSLVTGA